jgi:Domain of unknown function (DUF4932)
MRYLLLFSIFFMGINHNFAQNDVSAQVQDEAVLYQTLMLYELVNIAYALGDTNIYAGGHNVYFNNIDTSKVYYKNVIAHFKPYKNHAFVRLLNRELRQNQRSYPANLSLGTHLIWTKNRCKKVDNFPQTLLFYDFFGKRQRLLQDFAQQTNFENFYKMHSDYYTKNLINAQQRLLTKRMKTWLEREFSSFYDNYTIIMSPLVGGFHCTQNFEYKNKKKTIMWVSDSEGFSTKYTENQISGIYTGVVFTEIDHNYVNPVSDKYKKMLNKIMGGKHRIKWLKPDGDALLYKDGYTVFNEYMTHATYLIYTYKMYGADDQKVIENSRIKMMEKHRKYVQFAAFYTQLKYLYDNKKTSENLESLYPAIIKWVENQNLVVR